MDLFRFSKPTKLAVKIVILGDGCVGKTSMFDRLTQGDNENYTFNKQYQASTGHTPCIITCVINKQTVDIHLFDTAGQEKYGKLRDCYLLGADGVIIMYDIENPDTRQNVKVWLDNIERVYKACGLPNPPVVVSGNKEDLLHKCGPRESYVYRTAALKYMYTGPIDYVLMSVKAGTHLWDPINILMKHILRLWRTPQLS
jgi:small GTP-binding protein